MRLGDWVVERHGAEGWQRFLGRLPPPCRDRLTEEGIVQTSRISASDIAGIHEAIAGLWGSEGGYREAAYNVAYKDLRSYMRMFLRRGEPGYVLGRLPKVFRHYFSAGDLGVSILDETSARVKISGAEAYGQAALEWIAGWIAGALEYSGAQDVVIQGEITGPGSAEFELTWA